MESRLSDGLNRFHFPVAVAHITNAVPMSIDTGSIVARTVALSLVDTALARWLTEHKRERKSVVAAEHRFGSRGQMMWRWGVTKATENRQPFSPPAVIFVDG